MHASDPTPSAARAVDAEREGGAADPRRLRRVLLATDLSAASRAATDDALATAERDHAQLIVLSVVDPGGLRLPGGRFFRRIDQERADVETGVQAIVARARSMGIPATYLVWVGDPSELIVDAAASEAVDLIVMGSHGRGRVGRLLLGSTSTKVSATTDRPLRVVPS